MKENNLEWAKKVLSAMREEDQPDDEPTRCLAWAISTIQKLEQQSTLFMNAWAESKAKFDLNYGDCLPNDLFPVFKVGDTVIIGKNNIYDKYPMNSGLKGNIKMAGRTGVIMEQDKVSLELFGVYFNSPVEDTETGRGPWYFTCDEFIRSEEDDGA